MEEFKVIEYRASNSEDVKFLEERMELLDKYAKPNYNPSPCSWNSSVPVIVTYDHSNSGYDLVVSGCKDDKDDKPLVGLGLSAPQGQNLPISEMHYLPDGLGFRLDNIMYKIEFFKEEN